MKGIVTIHCKVVVHSVSFCINQVSMANLRNPRTLELETEVLPFAVGAMCEQDVSSVRQKEGAGGWWGQFLAGTS